ncbi:MAG: hypothetical protein OEV74_20645 [Cyclobacteriaceae bacterium]|nr:hypothetical protein [Cyclobacteriaceae bacterium]MDH5251578.1 hypothetical protein [Cyclobacteriaceae bacterium]
MRVAISQKKCVPGSVNDNIQDYLDNVKKAKSQNADLIVFPELSDTGYDLENMSSIASSYENGLPLNQLKQAASANEIAVIAGITEKSASHIYNSTVAIDKRGAVIANYRKIHLYTPNGEGVFTPGNEPVLFDFMGFRIGLLICYDLRFPEFARYLAKKGATVLIVPTAWPFPRVEHWNILTKARAIENQCYVVGVNRVGTECGFTFCGNSRIADPHGVLVASASEDQEELLVADLDQSKIDFIRKRQPIFSHIREDLF